MNTSTQSQITENTTIEGVLESFPDKAPLLIEIMSEAGLHCVGCGAATYETLEQGTLGHGFSRQQLHDLIEKLNAALEVKEQEEDGNQDNEGFSLTMTPKAIHQVKHMRDMEDEPGKNLRISVITGGCSGYSYDLHFVNQVMPGDIKTEQGDITVYISKQAQEVLNGIEIDYVMTLNESGFKYNNPNASKSCGCGQSFDVGLPFAK
ncbi:MAG: iron-sulfur cluster assembly accessory protein [Planctomycetes bacterium]|nr:iron-sulfur cluster assembly accessory protein [Planctomycetota bacterium]